MNDVFLTLAQAPAGLTCFLLPRVLPDGTRNAIALQRLKDKLGNRSNASAEIEYDGAIGWRIGDEGRGVPTILEMVTMTRLDCVLGSAGQMRAALSQAAYYAVAAQRLRPAAGRPAGDDGRAGRSGGRIVGGHRHRDPAAPRWSTLSLARRPGGSRAAPAGPAGGQVLGLQTRRPDDRRGAGMPGRQRLCRDLPDGPAAAGVAAERHLGGVRHASPHWTRCARWAGHRRPGRHCWPSCATAHGASAPITTGRFGDLDEPARRGHRPAEARTAWRRWPPGPSPRHC